MSNAERSLKLSMSNTDTILNCFSKLNGIAGKNDNLVQPTEIGNTEADRQKR